MNVRDGHPQTYRFGVFELDTLAHELRRQGARVRLQEQPWQILLLLVASAGKVVTREELRQALWSSSVYVDFDHGLNNAIARLRETLGDAAATPSYIETVPRLGYRFIYLVADATVPVTTAGVPQPDVPDTDGAPLHGAPSAFENESARSEARRIAVARWVNPRVVATGVVLAVVALGLPAVLWPAQKVALEAVATAVPSEPSVAVLPFVSISPDKNNEYFADGLAEELISKLAGIRGLKVASQTSSFQYKGRHEPAAAIAQALQVNHLLEGSVRFAGTRVRINAQLIDARDGYHRWSQTFDREFTDILQIQEDTAIAVANALEVKLLAADEQRLRRKGTRDVEAYKLVKRAGS